MTETTYQHTYNLQQIAAKILHQRGSKVARSLSNYTYDLQQVISDVVTKPAISTGESFVVRGVTTQVPMLSSVKQTALKLQTWPTGSLYLSIGLFIVLIVFLQYLLVTRGFMSLYERGSGECDNEKSSSKSEKKKDVEQ